MERSKEKEFLSLDRYKRKSSVRNDATRDVPSCFYRRLIAGRAKKGHNKDGARLLYEFCGVPLPATIATWFAHQV